MTRSLARLRSHPGLPPTRGHLLLSGYARPALARLSCAPFILSAVSLASCRAPSPRPPSPPPAVVVPLGFQVPVGAGETPDHPLALPRDLDQLATARVRWSSTGSPSILMSGDVAFEPLPELGVLRALSLVDGTERWRTDIGPGRLPFANEAVQQLMLPGGRVAVLMDGIAVVDPTGEIVWRKPGCFLDPVLNGGLIVVVDRCEALIGEPDRMFAIDPEDGRVAWTHTCAEVGCIALADSGGPITIADGPVLLHRTPSGTLERGASLPAGGREAVVLDPLGGLGSYRTWSAGLGLLLGSTDRVVEAFDAFTGAPKWSLELPGVQLAEVVDGAIYAHGATWLARLDEVSGLERWRLHFSRDLGAVIAEAPMWALDGGERLLIATPPVDGTYGVLVFVDAERGRPLGVWRGVEDAEALQVVGDLLLVRSGGDRATTFELDRPAAPRRDHVTLAADVSGWLDALYAAEPSSPRAKTAKQFLERVGPEAFEAALLARLEWGGDRVVERFASLAGTSGSPEAVRALVRALERTASVSARTALVNALQTRMPELVAARLVEHLAFDLHPLRVPPAAVDRWLRFNRGGFHADLHPELESAWETIRLAQRLHDVLERGPYASILLFPLEQAVARRRPRRLCPWPSLTRRERRAPDRLCPFLVPPPEATLDTEAQWAIWRSPVLGDTHQGWVMKREGNGWVGPWFTALPVSQNVALEAVGRDKVQITWRTEPEEVAAAKRGIAIHELINVPEPTEVQTSTGTDRARQERFLQALHHVREGHSELAQPVLLALTSSVGVMTAEASVLAAEHVLAGAQPERAVALYEPAKFYYPGLVAYGRARALMRIRGREREARAWALQAVRVLREPDLRSEAMDLFAQLHARLDPAAGAERFLATHAPREQAELLLRLAAAYQKKRDRRGARLLSALKPLAAGEVQVTLSAAELARDRDKDGLTDDVEAWLGTDPLRADTDGDGRDDARDSSPHCAPSGGGDGAAVRAAALRHLLLLRTSPQPVVVSDEGTCVELATLGGWLLRRSRADLVLLPVDGYNLPFPELTLELEIVDERDAPGGDGSRGPTVRDRWPKAPVAKVRYGFRRGPLSGHGGVLLLLNVEGEWRVVEEREDWVS